MPTAQYESSWDDPAYTVSELLRVISSSLGGDLVVWSQIESVSQRVASIEVDDSSPSAQVLAEQVRHGWSIEPDSLIADVVRSGSPRLVSSCTPSELADHGDARGYSFTLPEAALRFLGRVADVHFSSLLPGAVRGNHYHLRRREAILVSALSPWSWHWDEDATTGPQSRAFAGGPLCLILVSPGASHAIRNDGDGTIRLVALSSEPYDPTETIARKVV